MNAPSSLAWMLSEILHGCPAFARWLIISMFGFNVNWFSVHKDKVARRPAPGIEGEVDWGKSF
jgi:hypothetical protein